MSEDKGDKNPFLKVRVREEEAIPTSVITEAIARYPPVVGNSIPLVNQELSLRGLDGGMLLEVPNPEVIEALKKHDSRVNAFSYEIGTSYERIAKDARLHNNHIGEAGYNELVSGPLAKKLAEKYKDRKIAFRGIMCSINGTVYSGSMLVRDIREISQLGDEQARDTTLVAGFMSDQKIEQGKIPDDLTLHYRVNQYLSYSNFFGMDLQDPGAADKLFPALLVYDSTKLVKSGGSIYSYSLPSDPAERNKIILEAVVLPRPL